MSALAQSKFSTLDLAPVRDDGNAAQALHNSLALAQHVERLGFERFWVAEHHNMDGIASSATSVLLGYLAAGTSRIRLGSGGVMLPNHAPLVIAEQFGTLATLYPGRIELGLGRAPGADHFTAQALRRDRIGNADDFPADVEELQRYLGPRTPDQRVIVVIDRCLETSVAAEIIAAERDDIDVEEVFELVGDDAQRMQLRHDHRN